MGGVSSPANTGAWGIPVGVESKNDPACHIIGRVVGVRTDEIRLSLGVGSI